MFRILIELTFVVVSVFAEHVEISNESICFHGQKADELLKDYLKKYEEQGLTCHTNYRDCGEIDKKRHSGVYKVYPKGSPKGLNVYCDMELDNGGWTVLQRRLNGEEDFFRNWMDYEKGFGNLEKEFWLGNENLHILTSQGKYELRVDLEDFDNNKRYAKYSIFSVGDASSNYKLTVGGYSGDAGDAIARQNGQMFYTKDKDTSDKCAALFKGAWWYEHCHDSNLNGAYLKGEHKSFADGVEWKQWKGYYYSLKTTSMMFRKIK